MNLAVIPARGNSQRIPGKNIKLFCGRPIIEYTIEASLNSGVFDHVLVTTDNEEIAKISRDCGAEVPFFRPKELSDDHTSTVPVIKHAIEWVNDNWGPVSHACCIYATAPFVMPEDIKRAYSMLINEQVAGYVFTAARYSSPVQRAFRINEQGYSEMFNPELYNARSQDLEEAYHDAGQFYWGSAESYLNDIIFYSNKSRPYIIPGHRVQDIDTLEDWAKAEMMWRILDNNDIK